MDSHVTSLFGPSDDEDDDDQEQVPRSPFVLTGLPPEVRFSSLQIRTRKQNLDFLFCLASGGKHRVQAETDRSESLPTGTSDHPDELAFARGTRRSTL